MTQTEYEKKLKGIKLQEDELGVKINIVDIIDKDHLDCTWYGGELGVIEYKGYKIVIGAYGDIRLDGYINGSYVHIKDKNNNGNVYSELGHVLDDDGLYRLLDSDEDKNRLEFEDNNWFEVDLISPDGDWIDLCGSDNVLDGNLLDCFSSVKDYFDYVDEDIEERYKEFFTFLEDKNDNIDCLAFDLLCTLATNQKGISWLDDPLGWSMEKIGDLVDYAESLLREDKIKTCRPFLEDSETPCFLGKDCERNDCIFRKKGV